MLTDLGNIKSWCDYRRKRFWLLVAAAVYSLLGFFAVPWLITTQAPGFVYDNTQREATLGKVTFNPWTLKLHAEDFALTDADGLLFSFDALTVNLQVSSLFRFALVLREFAIDGPDLAVVRYGSADTNWGRMLDDMAALEPEPAAPPDESDPLRLVVGDLSISNGKIDIRDEFRAEPFETRIAPFNIRVSDLSTLPDVTGAQQISLTTENGVELTWSGDLKLIPLISSGRLELNGSPLPVVYRYFEDQLGFTLDNCCFKIGLDYAVDTTESDLEAQISNLSVVISDVAVARKGSGEPVFNLASFRIDGGSLAWPEQRMHIDSIVFSQPELFAWLNDDGSLNLENLLLAGAEAGEEVAELPEATAEIGIETEAGLTQPQDYDQDEEELPWDVSVDQFGIEGMRIGFTDRTLRVPGTLTIDALDLSVTDISNAEGARSPLKVNIALASGGTIALAGDAGLLPEFDLRAALNISELGLAGLQPWVDEAAQARIGGGQLFVTADIASGPTETLAFKGQIDVRGLDVTDTLKNQPLVGWQQLSLEKTGLALDANELEISQIRLTDPYATLVIAEDGTTNFQELVREEENAAAGEAESAQEETESAMRIRVGQTRLENGRLEFSDKSLPLPFDVQIAEFGGTLSALDSTSTQPSELDFKGRVGQYGYTSVSGAVSVLAPTEQTDIAVDFRNLNMPDLSPYTVDFAGRRIDSGKLNLDLDYRLEDNRVKGDNHIVISDFTLGDKVPSEDAMSLPLDLAVALLTDVNGVIDIDLEVTGDLDDPGFSASGIILKAFANLITKAVASPFKLLAGGDDDFDFDSILYLPGESSLTPPEREKLDKISEVMGPRATLALHIDTGYAPAADLPALARISVDNQVLAQLGNIESAEELDQILTKRIRKALEKIAQEQLPDLSLRDMRKEYDRPNPATGKEEFDEVAYIAALRGLLEEAQPLGDADLQALATRRGQTAADYLLARGEIDAARISVGGAMATEVTDDGWVKSPVTVEVAEQVSDAEPTTSSEAVTEAAE